MSIRQSSNQKGFSLIELIAVLAILALTLLIGVPALGNAVEKQRLRSATVEFVSTIRMARQEAINRNTVVTICPSLDGRACLSNQWSSGWIVFTGTLTTMSNNAIPTSDILLVKQMTSSRVTIATTNTQLQKAITYKASGRSSRNGTLTISTSPDNEAKVVFNILGRPKVEFLENS